MSSKIDHVYLHDAVGLCWRKTDDINSQELAVPDGLEVRQGGEEGRLIHVKTGKNDRDSLPIHVAIIVRRDWSYVKLKPGRVDLVHPVETELQAPPRKGKR